ncbi:MAG: hypothetical protein LBB39_03185, partial [Mycoplasmataceae bacterium]|nr:hypothetical protein [Mycoplasmataceae bacterium]
TLFPFLSIIVNSNSFPIKFLISFEIGLFDAIFWDVYIYIATKKQKVNFLLLLSIWNDNDIYDYAVLKKWKNDESLKS